MAAVSAVGPTGAPPLALIGPEGSGTRRLLSIPINVYLPTPPHPPSVGCARELLRRPFGALLASALHT